MPGALPNFVIIGSQKCGTTALHAYLSRHPQISMSRPKELNFFIEERNWPRGVEWYQSQFDADAPTQERLAEIAKEGADHTACSTGSRAGASSLRST